MAGSPNFPNDGSTYDGYDANTTANNTADSAGVPPVPSTSDDSGAGVVVSGPYPMFPDHDVPGSGA